MYDQMPTHPMSDQVLEIFDEAAKKVVLSIYPNYERIAADIKVFYPRSQDSQRPLQNI